MDLADLKSDAHRMLLGPLSLATEIFGALLPGCVFTALVCVKLMYVKREWVSSVWAYPLLGYKTKLALVIFASYIVGKVVLSVITLIPDVGKWIRRRAEHKKAKTAQPIKPTTLLQSLATVMSNCIEESPGVFQSFIGGIVAGPVITGKHQMLEHFSAYEAGVIFHLSTGFVFVLGAGIPGDGNWRLIEMLVGVILLARGIKSWYGRDEAAAGLFGVTLNSYLAGLQPGQLSAGLKAVWTAIITLSTTPAPGAAGASPSKPSVPTSSPSAVPEQAAGAAVGKTEPA